MTLPPEGAGQETQDAVGKAWQSSLQATGNYTGAEDTLFLQRFRSSPYIQKALRYAQLPPGSHILEPGCGSGKFSLALASVGHRVIALDYVATVLKGIRQAEERLTPQAAWLEGYCQGSLERLPFSDEVFDLVINEGVIEHWLCDAERLSVLREMVRVTRPAGVVAVIVPNGTHPLTLAWERRMQAFRDAPPMTHYSAASLKRELVQAGLREVAVDGIYPWRAWVRLSPWNRLYLLAAALDRWMPAPRRLGRQWGINLIALGRKRSR